MKRVKVGAKSFGPGPQVLGLAWFTSGTIGVVQGVCYLTKTRLAMS